MAGAGGAVLLVRRYDAFGGVVQKAGAFATDVGYRGERTDGLTGDQYLRARLYDPMSGRFRSMDPYSGNMGDASQWMRYGYAGANPVWGMDPSGQNWSTGSIVAAIGIGLNIASLSFNSTMAVRSAALGNRRDAAWYSSWAVIDAILLLIPFSGPTSLGGRLAVSGGGSVALPISAEAIELLAKSGYAVVLAQLLTSVLFQARVPSGFQEVDPSIRTDDLRSSPGTATGGGSLPTIGAGSPWIQRGVGLVPREVGDQLRGMSFANWGAFREAFWRAVSNVPHLRSQFSAANQAEMAAGRAPFAPTEFQLGPRARFEIDHMVPLRIGGERVVYDLDNLFIAGPRVNQGFESFVL